MQSTSETWKELAATDGVKVESKAIINSVEYTDIEPPVITRGTMQNGVSVGNVVSAMCMLTLDTSNTIPKSAEIQIQARLVGGTEDEPVYSEWLPQGTFYLSRRTKTPNTNTIVLECYDGLLKSNAIWEPSTGDWPRQASAVLAEIATIIGLQVDARTTIAAYTIGEPEAGATMRDMLGIIAQQNFGNWVVTHDNKLRLVPVVDLADAESATETVEVDAVIGDYYADEVKTVTGLRVNSDGITTLIGDETGVVVDLTIPAAIATQLANSVIGITYKPFTFGTAFYDIAAELGDFVHFYDTTSVLYNETVTLGPSMHGDIAAPDTADIGDEYPYVGASEKNLYTAKSYAEAVANEAVGEYDETLTQQQIFNKLTDNGAAQGVVLYNGQLYVNATYLSGGTIDGDSVNAKLLNIVDANGNVIASFDNIITLGQTTKAHAELDYNSFSIYDKNRRAFFEAGDLRDINGYADTKEQKYGDGTKTVFGTNYAIYSVISIKIDGVATTDYTYSVYEITFGTAPADGSSIVITYRTQSAIYHIDFGRSYMSDIGGYSVAAGSGVTASGNGSHAEGARTTASGDFSHSENYNTTASGVGSHAENYNTTASGDYSHAEGERTTASGKYSHAEGSQTTASGAESHAEGSYTTASGVNSHAEGIGSAASGSFSHAEGTRTIANGFSQHVFGKYNIEDNANTYVEIVGNGAAIDSPRSNARTLDWNGNEWIAGALSVGDPAGTRANIGASAAFVLTGDYTTAATIYSVLNTMARGSVATIVTRADASNAMCGLNYDMYGTIWRNPSSDSNNFYLSMTRTSGLEQYCYVLTLTDSSMSHGTVYKYTGTAV